MKAVVVYYSKHHGNTKKLIDAICEKNDVVLIDASKTKEASLSEYDLIGFASGIYYSKFHKSVINFMKNNLPKDKKVFFVSTYGVQKDGYTNAVKEIAQQKSAEIVGEYGCLGFNTFGPFKLIGGIAKGHPDEAECKGAVEFYDEILRGIEQK